MVVLLDEGVQWFDAEIEVVDDKPFELTEPYPRVLARAAHDFEVLGLRVDVPADLTGDSVETQTSVLREINESADILRDRGEWEK